MTPKRRGINLSWFFIYLCFSKSLLINCKNGSHFEKRVTLNKMGRTVEKRSHCKMGHNLKSEFDYKKWLALYKMSHIWKIGSHCVRWVHREKWVTLENE